MVTITAPGVEINELDLSQYNIDKAVEDTQNVLVVGFASKGKFNVPHEFTNQNIDSDLIDAFGTPTNEAERYFYNTCSEIIKREKVKLYAVRLPYDPERNKYCYSKYKLEPTDKKLITTLDGYYKDYSIIASTDSTLSDKYLVEVKNESVDSCEIAQLDKWRQGIERPEANEFIVVDKTQSLFGKIPVDSTHMTDQSRYMVGIFPIITTAANALYVLQLISNDNSILSSYESVSALYADERKNELLSNYTVYPASSSSLEDGNKNSDTISKVAALYFPTINMNEDGTFENERLKDIGVVVLKGFLDTEYNNKINYTPIEAYAGSLMPNDIDQSDGTSKFIDDIINTNSTTIEFYSNCFRTDFTVNSGIVAAAKSNSSTKSNFKTTSDVQTTTSYGYSDVGILFMKNQKADVFGFEEIKLEDKYISTDRIMSSLDETFEKCKNVNSMQIDLVVDAGVSNIAQFMTTVNADLPSNPWLRYYDITAVNGNKSAVDKWQIHNLISGAGNSAYTSKWQLVLKKYDTFCKLRKDCMFIADGLRPLCVSGNAKRVSQDDYRHTVANTIVPDIKYIANKINTSYGAGYCDWYKIVDPTSGVGIWMPPSSKAVLTYLDDTNDYDYWTAPAGVNYGRMNIENGPSLLTVIDIAFNPTVKEAGDIYTKQWNYAAKYSDAGFVIEGQKTFLTKQTAFDRVNVRRLFLYLERKTYNAAKYFIYQGNTAYTRQRLVDAITPYFEDAKVRGGLYDYRIQCDENNNTASTIDANELHVKIAIKPTKTIEFIECTFVALKTSASFTEAGMED